MRPFVLLALIGIGVALAYRTYITGKIPVISFAIITLIALPLAITEGLWIDNQRTLSTAAKAITGRADADVHCQRATEAMFYANRELGRVAFDENGRPSQTSFLTMGTCQDIKSWIASDKSDPTIEQVQAVHILTHEAMHVAGHRSESSTECYAMQEDERMAIQLGATPEQGRALAEMYYKQIYPRMADNYRSRDCVPSGTLDLSPNDEQFP